MKQAEAEARAKEAIIASGRRAEGEIFFQPSRALFRPYGWVLFYNGPNFVETGDLMNFYAYEGSPVVVRFDGVVEFLDCEYQAAATIAAYEKANDLV